MNSGRPKKAGRVRRRVATQRELRAARFANAWRGMVGRVDEHGDLVPISMHEGLNRLIKWSVTK